MELGRFGHHPDPAIDFLDEVESLIGIAYNVKVGLDDKAELSDRVFRARTFRVGGDERCVSAMKELRKIEASL